jgi:hypothetical protein
MQASWQELVWANVTDGTALASSSSEGSLLAGLNEQPVFEAFTFAGPMRGRRTFRIRAAGVFSNTGTPTLTFQLRLGTTAGASDLTGASLAQSTAISTSSGVTNVLWELEYVGTVRTPGLGTGNATVSGWGVVRSPAGFASPFAYAMAPSIGSPAGWTQTFNAGLDQFINLSATWSASSASNTITLKHMTVELLN